MQDTNTPRAYRMHDLRQCLDCPASFTRAHYAEHGRITPEAQRAAAARRRQRVVLDMDEADRLLSAEYRKAIRNDPCFYCGSAETHHVDHYFPLAKGGTDAWFNLRAACRDCNLSKFTTCGTAFLLRAGDLTRT
jgi:5-methylcytosine-specific restriction endonuclease McrA